MLYKFWLITSLLEIFTMTYLLVLDFIILYEVCLSYHAQSDAENFLVQTKRDKKNFDYCEMNQAEII